MRWQTFFCFHRKSNFSGQLFLFVQEKWFKNVCRKSLEQVYTIKKEGRVRWWTILLLIIKGRNISATSALLPDFCDYPWCSNIQKLLIRISIHWTLFCVQFSFLPKTPRFLRLLGWGHFKKGPISTRFHNDLHFTTFVGCRVGQLVIA